MNSREFTRRAQDLQARAASRRKEAERHTYNAQTYKGNEDDTKAGVEEDLARGLIAEAESFESEADQQAQTALAMEARAQQLEAEKAKVKAEYESKIAEIENEQTHLTGGRIGLL